MRHLYLFLFVVYIIGFTCGSVHAQLVSYLARQEEEMLSLFYRVTTLATLTEREHTKTHVATTIITRSTIERVGARTIEDILRLVPGMQVGKSTIGYPRLYLRGVPSQGTENIKVFLDGHDMSSALTDGSAFFLNRFPADFVEKVEIIRGPGSALYGSDAISGVINIVTIPDKIESLGMVGSLGYGSWDATRASSLVSAPLGSGWVHGGLSYFHTNGARVHVSQDALGMPGRTNDREERIDAVIAIKRNGFTFHGYYLSDRSGGYYNPGFYLTDKTSTSWEEFFSDLTYETDFFHDALSFKGKIFFNRHKHHFDIFFRPKGWVNAKGILYPDGITTMIRGYMDNYGAEWEATYHISSAHALTMGFEARQAELHGVSTKANYDPRPLPNIRDVSKEFGWILPANRFFWGAFGQYQWDIAEDAYVVVGARYDYYDDVGDVISPNAGIFWGLTNDVSISLHYSKGYRAPAFREMYKLASGPPIIGNPDLRPEESNGVDITLRWWPSSTIGLEVSGFYSEIDDLICALDQEFQNIGTLTSKGVELSVDIGWQNLSLDVSGAYIKSRMDEKDFTGISNWIASSFLTYELNRKWWFGTFVYFVGPTDVNGDTFYKEIDDYTNIDLVMGAHGLLSENIGPDLTIAIRNILDDEYSYPEVTGVVPQGLKQPGISVDAWVTFRF